MIVLQLFNVFEIRIKFSFIDTHNDFFEKNIFWVIFALFANYETKRGENCPKKT